MKSNTQTTDSRASSGILTGARCRCCGCGGYFNSVTAFDMHRVGRFPDQRRCLGAEGMTALGMVRNGAGFWITEAREDAHGSRGRADSSRFPSHPATTVGAP
jgi:hypothetical protein